MSRPIWVIDAETDPFAKGRIPEPFIWGLYDGENPVRYFTETSELVAFLSANKVIVYAHNGGRFDYHLGILRYLEPYSQVSLINGRLARFTIGECEFRDSVNILPIALKDFRKDEIDYSKLERKVRHKHMAEIKRYLATDCEALHELVTKFVAEYGSGLTLAGCAMKVWQKMTDTPSIANHKADYFRKFKPFYTGGRVQCFHQGIYNGAFNVLDINSAYPFAMLHDHPFSHSFDPVDNPPKNAKVRTSSMYILTGRALRGFAPVRNPSTDTVTYPSDGGTYLFHLTGWELQAGIDTDSIEVTKIHTRFDFPVVDNFSKYIHHFYGMKKGAQKGSPEYIFAKLFMNSLY